MQKELDTIKFEYRYEVQELLFRGSLKRPFTSLSSVPGPGLSAEPS